MQMSVLYYLDLLGLVLSPLTAFGLQTLFLLPNRQSACRNQTYWKDDIIVRCSESCISQVFKVFSQAVQRLINQLLICCFWQLAWRQQQKQINQRSPLIAEAEKSKVACTWSARVPTSACVRTDGCFSSKYQHQLWSRKADTGEWENQVSCIKNIPAERETIGFVLTIDNNFSEMPLV